MSKARLFMGSKPPSEEELAEAGVATLPRGSNEVSGIGKEPNLSLVDGAPEEGRVLMLPQSTVGQAEETGAAEPAAAVVATEPVGAQTAESTSSSSSSSSSSATSEPAPAASSALPVDVPLSTQITELKASIASLEEKLQAAEAKPPVSTGFSTVAWLGIIGVTGAILYYTVNMNKGSRAKAST